jgi:hypothetical protein
LTESLGLAVQGTTLDSCRLLPAYPFELDPSLGAAGYGLNTNENGIQDYGELAVDCGGAGMDACTDVPLDLQIKSVEQIDLHDYQLTEPGWDIRRVDGTLNGRTFELIVAYAAPHPFTNSDIGVVYEHPSRLGHPHAPPVPFRLGAAAINRAASGGITIAMVGVTGGHPYVYSAQEAVLASRYLREAWGRSHIITTGLSYGAATALTNAALYPEHFDGVVAFAAPYNARQFLSWNDANGLRFLGAGLATSDGLYYSELDGMTMAAAQAGLTVDNLDLTALGNARVPASIILGEVDGVWVPGNFAQETRERLRRDGIDWIDIIVGDEDGHGGSNMSAAYYRAMESMYDTVRSSASDDRPTVCARPRQRDTSYDEMLRPAPTRVGSPYADELWSRVTQVENTAPTASASSGMSVFTGSVQGFVTRRDLGPGGQTSVEWRVPVGRVVKSVAVFGETVVVGSLRGIAVLDARDGSIVREATNIGTVTNVIIADVIPQVAGLEIAARVDMDLLRVSRLDTGEVLSQTQVGTGGGLVMSDAFGPSRLYAPLARGHVAGFEFVQNPTGDWRPVARWLSDYLANDLQTIAFLERAGEPVLLAGGRILGGLVSQTGATLVEGYCIAALKVVDGAGSLLDEIRLPGCVVNQIIPWAPGEAMIGVTGRALLTNILDGTANPWPNATHFSHAITSVGDGAPRRVLSWWNAGGHRLTTFDSRGATVQTEHLGNGIAPAMDIFHNPDTGRDELSVLTNHYQTWRITRYDLHTGTQIGAPIQRPYALPPGRTRRPNRLVRTARDFAWSSYEIFLNDGAVFANAVRVATRCGRWFASASLAHEQLHHFREYEAGRENCTLEWPHIPVGLTNPGDIMLSERVGTGEGTLGAQRGGLRFIDLDGPESHFLMSTAGGNVALFGTDAAINTPIGTPVSPLHLAQVGGQTTSLATGGDGDSAVAVLGSWMPAADGATIHVMDPHTLSVRHSFDAGPVLAVALANVNSDAEPEIIVGTQDGFLKVYSMLGELHTQWSVGDLHLGEGGSLQVRQHDGYAVVAFPVTGGFRVVEVRM